MPFDFHDVLVSIAPRAVFINAPTGDYFLVDGVRETLGRVQHLFPSAALQAVHPDDQHSFPEPARHAAYAFLHQQLGCTVTAR